MKLRHRPGMLSDGAGDPVAVRARSAGLPSTPFTPSLPLTRLDQAPRGRPTRPRPGGPRLKRRHRSLLLVADAAALAASAVLGAFVLHLVLPGRAGELELHAILVTALAMALSLHVHGLYRRPASKLRPSGWWRPWVVARCLPTAALLALGTEAVLFGSGRMTITAAVAMTAPAVLLVPAGRRLIVRAFDSPTVTRIVVVGTGRVADRLTTRLSRCSDTAVIGHVDDDPDPDRPVLGRIAELPELCREHEVDRIVVAFSDTPDSTTLESLRLLRGQIPISVIPRMFELNSWRSEIEELHGLPLLHVPPATLGLGAQLIKRVLDLVVAVTAAVVTLPIWLGVAVAIKLDSAGPVFFRQDRSGRGGQVFRIFKFRTMSDDAWQRRTDVAGSNEVDGPLFKMAQDPRVTRVGGFLRRTSLDEIPQLLNVIRGEMSLVGPRPLPTEESDRLDGAALTRFDVAPGITGLWQISGRSDLTYADLQHLDSVYVRSWSLLWDLRIIMATPHSVFAGRGAY